MLCFVLTPLRLWGLMGRFWAWKALYGDATIIFFIMVCYVETTLSLGQEFISCGRNKSLF